MRKIHNKDRKYRQENKFILWNNKAITEMVAYVLLVMIALILSIMVYGFLKLVVGPEKPVCNEGISIAIDDYVCNAGTKEINITFKNTGRWDIDGFFIRANNRTEGDAVYPLISPGFSVGEKIYLAPSLGIGQKLNLIFVYSELGNITKITIQPFMANKTLVSCSEAKITQEIENCNEMALLPGTCTDGIQNEDESDVDCGGSCSGCVLGKSCLTWSDCLSGLYCDLGSGSTCQNAPPGPAIPTSLVSWWKFEGNGNDEKGAVNLSTSLLVSADWVNGIVGKAMSVDAQGKYVKNSTPISGLQLTGDFTIEAMVYLNAIPTTFTNAFIIGELNNSVINYGIKINTDGKVALNYTSVTAVTSSDALQTGTWYHVAAVKSGNNLKLYINGIEQGSGVISTSTLYLKDQLYLGWIGNGMTDEVAIYNSALFKTEISKHYQNALAGKNYFSS